MPLDVPRIPGGYTLDEPPSPDDLRAEREWDHCPAREAKPFPATSPGNHAAGSGVVAPRALPEPAPQGTRPAAHLPVQSGGGVAAVAPVRPLAHRPVMPSGTTPDAGAAASDATSRLCKTCGDAREVSAAPWASLRSWFIWKPCPDCTTPDVSEPEAMSVAPGSGHPL